MMSATLVPPTGAPRRRSDPDRRELLGKLKD